MSPHSPELYPAPPIVAGFCDLIPPKTSHHRKKIVRFGKYSRLADSPELTSARATWIGVLAPFRPPAPIEGALRLELCFVWPWRKSDAKQAAATDRIPYPSRPDADNLAKTVADVMATLGYFRDDAQVVELYVCKHLGAKPGLAFGVWSVSV